MKHFMVYTVNGDYDVVAWNAAAAVQKVERMTLGRCGMIYNVEEIAR